MTRPYQCCTKKECIERQGLRQVSELEANLETCCLPQAKRIMDPRLAVKKYRRAAAGSSQNAKSCRGREDLCATLSHLTEICASSRATPNHPPVDDMVVINFVTDRLRSCQADATKLSGRTRHCVPAYWHARVIRILIWLEYRCIGFSDKESSDNARMIAHMRSTAYDA